MDWIILEADKDVSMTTNQEIIMDNIQAFKLIKSINAYERITGLTIIAGTNDVESINLIVTKLFDPHYLVRVAAAKALHGTTNQEAIKALYDAAEDSVAEVRRACLAAAPSISGTNSNVIVTKVAA